MNHLQENIFKREFTIFGFITILAGGLGVWIPQAFPAAFLSALLTMYALIKYGYRVGIVQELFPIYYNKFNQKALKKEYDLAQKQVLIAEAGLKEKWAILIQPLLLNIARWLTVSILPFILYHSILKPRLDGILPREFISLPSYLFCILFIFGCLEAIYNYLLIPHIKNTTQLKNFIETSTPFIHAQGM